MAPALGVCFHRFQSAGDIVAQARAAEASGFDELWVVEDCFFTAGPPLAAAALAATDRIRVGIGIIPSRTRHPALIAMEFATLAQLAPGRFLGGIGHGVPHWMRQLEVQPASPLTALRETLTAVRQLLAGETVTTHGRYVNLTEVRLDLELDQAPPVSAGVQQARSLELSGRYADGTILAELCNPAYLAWARGHIAASGAGGSHRTTVFCSASVKLDGAAAREAMVPFVAGVFERPPLAVQMLDFYPELQERAATAGWIDAVTRMPPEWWRQLGPIGTPDDAAGYLRSMRAAHADSLVIFPDPTDPIADLRRFAINVGPLLAD
ncbi:MAG: LLM class flavin-dependent oxidoreductase [Acidimicrobiales bacterium]